MVIEITEDKNIDNPKLINQSPIPPDKNPIIKPISGKVHAAFVKSELYLKNTTI